MIFGIVALALAAPTSVVEPAAGACQLRSSYDSPRDLAFTRAATQLPQHSADLSRLKRAVRAEGLDVQSVSYDPATGRLECRMTLRLALPASAQPYFGADSVGGPVRYWAEPQDDGSGFSVVTEGLAPIIAKVMTAAAHFPTVPDFGIPAPTAPVAAAAAAAATPTPTPTPRRLPKAGFDCALASTSVEQLICGSDALAEADRTMSERYFAVRATLHGPARQRQLASQRKFLGRRNACGGEACLVGLYMARAAELARP